MSLSHEDIRVRFFRACLSDLVLGLSFFMMILHSV